MSQLVKLYSIVKGNQSASQVGVSWGVSVHQSPFTYQLFFIVRPIPWRQRPWDPALGAGAGPGILSDYRQHVGLHARQQSTAVWFPSHRAHRAAEPNWEPHRVQRTARDWQKRVSLFHPSRHIAAIKYHTRVSGCVHRTKRWVTYLRGPNWYDARAG